jgi:erythromycin esterase-like protein
MFTGCNTPSTVLSKATVIELPQVSEMNSESFRAADPYLQDRSIVQLGESIHMTSEFPLARIAFAKRLFVNHSFDMILFEGSAVEAWVASDSILRKQNPSEADFAKARDIAFPGIWRSPEYKKVFSAPFYVASYDMQPGMGSLRQNAMTAFLDAVNRYVKIPAAKKSEWNKTLGLFSNRKTGFPNAQIANKEEIEKSITDFANWLPEVIYVIENKYPKSPHAAMLKVIPELLKAQLSLWEAHQHDEQRANFKTFQETRDRLGAANIQKIVNEVSKSHKVAVWAHHVHVFHNSQNLSRHSLGSDLKNTLGDKVYTIGLFAEAGECYSLADMEEIVEGPLEQLSDFGFETQLSKLGNDKNFFVDLKALSDLTNAAWINQATFSRREGNGKISIVPVKDFDAAIYIRKVSKPYLKIKEM